MKRAGKLQEGIVYVQKMRGLHVNTYINRLFLHMKDKAIASLSEMNTRHIRYADDFELNLSRFVKEVQSADHENCAVMRGLETLGVKNAAVYLYDDPIEYDGSKYDLSHDSITLACTIKNGEIHMLSAGRGNCHIGEFFSHRSLPAECSSYAVFPVFFRKTIYGFLVLEADNTIYTRGECIASLLARTIYLNSGK